MLLPTTPAFSLFSDPAQRPVSVEPSIEAVRHGAQDGESDFIALGGSFTVEAANAPLLLDLLPEMIHIPASEGRTTRLGRVIELLYEECRSDLPGKDLIIRGLLATLLVEALRWQRLGDREMSFGLLPALHDPALARALQAIHADVGGGLAGQ